MSLWFKTRDKDGTVQYVSTPFELLPIFALVGMGVALLLPLVQTFRMAVATSPVFTAIACVSILMVGFAFFASAKLSVIRAGRLVSFGPSTMSRNMWSLYYVGYILLVVGTIAVLLFLLAASVTGSCHPKNAITIGVVQRAAAQYNQSLTGAGTVYRPHA